MGEDQLRLDAQQVSQAGLTDWRQILGRIKARFRTGDFATGVALVNGIAEAAQAANHHPEVSLTYGEVIVTLTSHDAGGITSRDIELARQISSHAAAVGAPADVVGLTQLELGLDTAHGSQLAPFYTALLGSTTRADEVVDSSGQVPTLWWQSPGEDDEGPALPEQSFEQRWHLDVWVPQDQAEHRLQAVLAAGGRLVSDLAAPSYWVVEDPEGNRSCICTPADR